MKKGTAKATTHRVSTASTRPSEDHRTQVNRKETTFCKIIVLSGSLLHSVPVLSDHLLQPYPCLGRFISPPIHPRLLHACISVLYIYEGAYNVRLKSLHVLFFGFSLEHVNLATLRSSRPLPSKL